MKYKASNKLIWSFSKLIPKWLRFKEIGVFVHCCANGLEIIWRLCIRLQKLTKFIDEWKRAIYLTNKCPCTHKQ